MDDFVNPNNMNFDDNIFNPSNNDCFINEKEIHIYKQKRGGRKYDTIIQGFQLSENEEVNKSESKKFITMVKKKFGKGGCQKIMEDFDKVIPVFTFQGDIQEEIQDILIKDFNKNEDKIILHGE